MNDILYIAGRLDGMSIDRTGYRIKEVRIRERNDNVVYDITVEHYRKEDIMITEEEEVSIHNITGRIEGNYMSDRPFTVVSVEKNDDGTFDLTLEKKVKEDDEKEDGDEEKGDNDNEEVII